ncbi:MAG: polymer-forming cytoskeletal protein [Methylophilaceae bacterium]
MFFKKKIKMGAVTTLIDKDLTIRGDTTYSGGLRLDGKIFGNLTLLGNDKNTILIMGEGSKVTGNIIVETGIINGEIRGNIKCMEYLELNANAIITGDIEYGALEIHAGAKVNGNLSLIKKDVARKRPKEKLILKQSVTKKVFGEKDVN